MSSVLALTTVTASPQSHDPNSGAWPPACIGEACRVLGSCDPHQPPPSAGFNGEPPDLLNDLVIRFTAHSDPVNHGRKGRKWSVARSATALFSDGHSAPTLQPYIEDSGKCWLGILGVAEPEKTLPGQIPRPLKKGVSLGSRERHPSLGAFLDGAELINELALKSCPAQLIGT